MSGDGQGGATEAASGGQVSSATEARETASDGRDAAALPAGSQRSWVLHPFLLCIYFVYWIWAEHRQIISLLWPLPTLTVLGLLSGGWMIAVKRWLGWRKAGATASALLVGLVGVFTFLPITEHLIYFAGVGTLVAVVLLWRWRGDLRVFTSFANVVSGVLLLFLLIGAVSALFTKEPVRVKADYLQGTPVLSPGEAPPDIWWIVLDGYGREDVLQRKFGMPGIAPWLREQGFHVVPKARANYTQTALALSSTLNLDYLEPLLEVDDPGSDWRMPMRELIGHSRVVRALKTAGYRVVSYPGDYRFTDLEEVDEVRSAFPRWSEFEHGFLTLTAVPSLFRVTTGVQGWPQHQVRRHHLKTALARLAAAEVDPTRPTFTAVHLVAPHPPFVFEADGSYRRTRGKALLTEGAQWDRMHEIWGENYREGYRAQTQWLDSQLQRVVSGILQGASRPQVIILQGDHGPGLDYDADALEQTDIEERLSPLLAIYLPSAPPPPETMSGVNIFRYVLTNVLGAQLSLLEDRSYFQTWWTPYQGLEVTRELR